MAEKADPTNHTGLSDEQAKEVHQFFLRGAYFWGGTAVLAHVLVWSWLPWFPVS
ncbi:MAG: light-harvesting antenna LH1, beta subunit [Pseudomonadota bacterium]